MEAFVFIVYRAVSVPDMQSLNGPMYKSQARTVYINRVYQDEW